MLTRPAWSNESGPWNEKWRRLEPGYVVEQPLLASPWEWGRTVLTGSMAESEELAAIYPRMASLEDQVSYLESSIESRFDAVAEQINSKVKAAIDQVAVSSFWKGVRVGAFGALLLGGGAALIIR